MCWAWLRMVITLADLIAVLFTVPPLIAALPKHIIETSSQSAVVCVYGETMECVFLLVSVKEF